MDKETNKQDEDGFSFKNLKENVFVSPDNYFDELPHLIGARVGAEKTKASFWSWGISTITACLLIFGFIYVETQKDDINFYAESIIESYTDDDLNDVFEEEEVIDFLTDEDYN
mgnify:CR=1 FL=1